MCKFYGVSKSGYYDWLKRSNGKDKDLFLKELITECQEKHKKRYGYRRVVIWLLREYGLIANHKVVLRVMNKYSLLSIIRRKGYWRRALKDELRYPNLLERDFRTLCPDQKWATDISCIKTPEGYLYVSMIKDLYDNFIVGHKMSRRQDYSLVKRTLAAADKNRRMRIKLIIHSDQGNQYTSNFYKKDLELYGLTGSMSRPGTPLDNACAENFFSSLKTESIYRERPKTLADAEAFVNEFVDYYNYERVQIKTKMTPYEKRCLAFQF